MSNQRTSYIRKVSCVGENASGSNGPDTMWVVDMFENGRKIETRSLPGKSRSYAESLSENWDTGVIQFLVD
jgi:hypothetical protein